MMKQCIDKANSTYVSKIKPCFVILDRLKLHDATKVDKKVEQVENKNTENNSRMTKSMVAKDKKNNLTRQRLLNDPNSFLRTKEKRITGINIFNYLFCYLIINLVYTTVFPELPTSEYPFLTSL